MGGDGFERWNGPAGLAGATTEGSCAAVGGTGIPPAGAAGGIGGRAGAGEASGVANGKEIGSPIEMSSGVKAGAAGAAGSAEGAGRAVSAAGGASSAACTMATPQMPTAIRAEVASLQACPAT
jgi:hypothetical protein